jgi:hypothetical protein
LSTLKPRLYFWLFLACLHISSKQETIKKGWEKCGLLFSLDSDFQKEAMLDNMKTPLFKQKVNEAMERNINIGEEETNAEKTLEVAMIESLTKVEKLLIASATPFMALFCGMARKK